MSKKVKLTLSIDQEIVKSAKQIGLNLSQFCENALTEAVNALKSSNSRSNSKKEVFNQVTSTKKAQWTGGDLNPRPPECKSGVRTS